MNFLFDNNLPPSWAATFAAASQRSFPDTTLGEVCHLREKFAAHTKDQEWLTTLGKEGNWVVVSCDKFRKQGGAERQVIRQYGLSVFVLQPSWASKRYWEKLSQFALWWPRIVEQSNTVEASTVEVPWKISSRFKQL
ncbi:hypothetical protein [Achromobacter animicus]|uniref:PIN-like domain-containing protein n=1 Tax=Achromobacter animicus TaxID=1389935 RepID=UPI00158422D8|nr:hypothetical protein [Achromobacter animicus]